MMILYDEVLPEVLQPITMIREAVQRDHLGISNGKSAFGYAISLSPIHKGSGKSIISQLRNIDGLALAYSLRIDPAMLCIDLASVEFSTQRIGLHKVRVACRSNLYDFQQIVVESPDRISRMPDEMEALRQEFQKCGKYLLCHTVMPAAAMAELDTYLTSESHVPSGYLK